MFQKFKFIVLSVRAEMESQRKAPNKYNKVNQQKKYHLLSLVYRKATPLKDAAEIVGINFLTAKTILFFHKNQCKSYMFDLSHDQRYHQNTSSPTLTASVESLRRLSSLEVAVEVICSTGSIINPTRVKPAALIQISRAAEEEFKVQRKSRLAGYRSLGTTEATREPERE